MENPKIIKTKYCHIDSDMTVINGNETDIPSIMNRLTWLAIAYGEFSFRLWIKDSLIPKRMLDRSFRKRSLGELSYIMIEPPTIPPKMKRYKNPCFPASDSQIIAKTIPPEALQP